MEKWKDIKGFEGNYQISNLGRVKSKFRIRKPTATGKYLKIDLYPGNKQYTIHRLVAEHFIPNPNNFELVMHIDNNPHNNNITNLKWGTYSMNAKQCVKDGRHKGYENGNGKRRTEI